MGNKKLAWLIGVALLAGNLAAMAQQYSVTDLGTLGGTSSWGAGLNASGQVTGDSYTTGNVADHAFLYSNGSIQDLGTLGGSYSEGEGINASGQVTGTSYTAENASSYAFLYSNGTMRSLGTLGGTYSAGYGINGTGQVTGYSTTAGNAEHAFPFSNGVMTDLNSLLSTTAESLYTLTEGVGINDNGQIVADGYVDAARQNVAFLLTPAPSPAPAWLLVIGIGALIAFSRRSSNACALACSTREILSGCVTNHSRRGLHILNARLTSGGFFMACFLGITVAINAHADDAKFSTLYTFEVADPNTGASQLGSQPDTRPVLGPNHSVYGMTYTGGANGNGVIYRYDLHSRVYKVLHTFAALDANGANDDGANPGVALTRGPDDVFYGIASFGGAHGNGTIFKITAAGKFTVLHSFGAMDSSLHNEDGANPLRAVVIGEDGNLYGTTRLGGIHTCGPKSTGCGVAWVMTRWGSFSVVHQFEATEGHAASLMRARDGYFYGCAVWPFAAAGSGMLYRMSPGGHHFEVLYRFTPVDGNGNNMDGANCYEPLVEKGPGEFYGAAYSGGSNGNGTVFRYSLASPTVVETVHAFSASNAAGENPDGANPYARLTRSDDGDLYSTASYGGKYGNGVVYRIDRHGHFELLHTFSATDPTTGSNTEGANPDYGVLIDEENDRLIGIADYGGLGSIGGAIGNGTLYQLKVH